MSVIEIKYDEIKNIYYLEILDTVRGYFPIFLFFFFCLKIFSLLGHTNWLTGVAATSTDLYSASVDSSKFQKLKKKKIKKSKNFVALIRWRPDSKESVYWMLPEKF